jgi:TolA-binding protein
MNREPGVYCERVLQDDIAVAYLRGDLPEEERDVFERHVFECADCFERLQVVRGLQAVLRQDAPQAAPGTRPGRAIRRPPATGWLAWAAGAAFVAVGAAMVLRNLGTPVPLPSPGPTAAPTASASAVGPADAPSPSEQVPLDVLARVEPPPYAPLTVRGGDPGEAAFARAMDAYVRGDYAAAAGGLRAALKEDPGSVEARFYLGVSELLAGRPDEAIRQLGRVAQGEDEAFAEAARYYLAKAHLARRDIAAARRELRRVAQGDGGHKEQAGKLLQALGAEP